MPRSREIQPRSNTSYAWGVCGFLLLAVGLVFGQTVGHSFIDYDDNGYVFENPHVTPGLTGEGIRWALTDGPYGEWYPPVMLSHMLDCQLFGLNAWGHHLTNLLLHAAASITLFLVWWRMTGELWPSAFVATVFAVHPQHVESVAWVAERRDVLSGLFFVLTLMAWLGYVRHDRSLWRYALTAALFALGLMSKPMLVTLPPLLLLLDFWPLARCGMASDTPGWTQKLRRPGAWRLVLEKLPLLALAVGNSLIALRPRGIAVSTVALSERIANAPVACVTYLVQCFYPVDLAISYPFPLGGTPAWKVAGASTLLAAISLAAVLWRRKCPYFFVGWFWYLGMLSPVLGLVQFAVHAMANRYMYLPGIGLYVALAWGAARLCARWPERGWVLGAGAGVVIAVLAALAAWQTSFWRDEETLWRRALACTSDNGEAEYNLGLVLARQERFDEAIEHYRRAELRAINALPFIGLGRALAWQGKLDEASAHFRQALARDPNSSLAHAGLARALARQGRFAESMEHFRRALEIDPTVASVHFEMAHVYRLDGKIDQARAEFERAVELDPRDAAARHDLGQVLFQQGRIDASIAQFRAVLAIDPNSLLAHINLARALAANGQRDEAMAHFRRVLEIDPRNAVARQNLDRLLRAGAEPPAP